MKRARLLQVMTKNTTWLYVAEALPRLASLFVVPIWSARVAPEEYARWILALTSAELAIDIGGLGFASFLTKVLYRYHDERAQRYFGMGASVVLGATAVMAALVAVCSPWLSQVVIGGRVRHDLFAWLGLYMLLAQVTNLAIVYQSTLVRYGAYFVLVTLRWICNAGLLLFYLLVHGQGFYSWVWAWLGTEALLLPVSMYQLREVQWGWWRRRMLTFAFRFSLPSLATTGLASGQSRVGRYLLSFAGVTTGLGLYGIAQNVARNYGAVVRPTKLVAVRLLGHALEERAESPHYLEFFHGFACLALSVAFLLSLFLGDLMKLFVSPAYWGATAALPFLIFALYLEEMCTLYQSLMFRYFKVWFPFLGSLVAFPIVIAATIALVPRVGFLGAALAQLAGAAATLVFSQWYANRVSARPFRFVEKVAFTLGVLLLAVIVQVWVLSIFQKTILAITVLSWYLLFHWRRRTVLFPLAARMTSGPRALYVIQWLGRDPLMWWWMCHAWARGATVAYATGHPGVIAWWKRHAPPGRLTEFVSECFRTAEPHLTLYELTETQAEQIGRSQAAQGLGRLFPHPQMGRTLRRFLRQAMFNQWLVSWDVERLIARGDTVRFFPRRNDPWINRQCQRAWGAVPRGYRIALGAKGWLGGVVLPIAIAMGLVARVLWRRQVCGRPPVAQRWKIAQKIQPSLPTTRVPDNELLYADGDLDPRRILHVVDGRDVTPESLAYFQALGSRVVCPERLSMPLRYFLTRACWGFFMALVVPCGLAALVSRAQRGLSMAAVRLGWYVMVCEVFAMHHQPQVYFGFDAYDVLFNIRTMVWERSGTRCVGITDGPPEAPMSCFHGLYAHVLLLPGEGMRRMFGRTLEAVGRVVSVGHVHTELALGQAPAPGRSGHVVVAFDSSFCPIWGLSMQVFRDFYAGLLELVDAYPAITLHLKRKYLHREEPNPAYAEVEEAFERHPRIAVFYGDNAYHLLAEADSVVAIAGTTMAVQALACRKPTVVFDTRSMHANNRLRRYHPFLVCHATDELLERYARVLAGRYPVELMEAVVSAESKFYDERPLSFVRKLLLSEATRSAPEGTGLRPIRPLAEVATTNVTTTSRPTEEDTAVLCR